jgi:hypothetical protein
MIPNAIKIDLIVSEYNMQLLCDTPRWESLIGEK